SRPSIFRHYSSVGGREGACLAATGSWTRCSLRIAHAELRRLKTVPGLGSAPRRSALRKNRRLARAEREPPMNANERELILKEEVYAVVSCAIEVLNIRGHGLHEKIYENCLCVEFRLRGIPYTQQERHRVLYKGEIVGE